MRNTKNYLATRLEERQHDGELDRGDAVQTVLVVAGFAIVVILIVAWIATSVKGKGAHAAYCIEQSKMGTQATSGYVTNGENFRCYAEQHTYDWHASKIQGNHNDAGWNANQYDNGKELNPNGTTTLKELPWWLS